MALIQTLEPFFGQSKRSGESEFGGKIFYWSEEIINASNEFNQLNIYVGIDKNSIIYELNTFIEKFINFLDEKNHGCICHAVL